MFKYKALRRAALVLRDLQVFLIRAHGFSPVTTVLDDYANLLGEAAKNAAESSMVQAEDAAYNVLLAAEEVCEVLEEDFTIMQEENDHLLAVIRREVI